MSLEEDFSVFIESLKPTNIKDMEITVKGIAKKLNKFYYDLREDGESNVFIVGSVGRNTAINGVSDLDIIFDLPKDIYNKYNNYKTNGQSALLQEIKCVLKERYSNTNISGDGQVVVINFNKYTVELVPGFKQQDNSFKYPDTHNGGSWKITKPLEEIHKSKEMIFETNYNFKYITNILRAWKNKQCFKFGGLLIDTLAYNFLNDNPKYKNIGFSTYLDMIKDLFKYLKNLNKNNSYWYALGSNQKVYNCDNGKFIIEAEKSYKKIEFLSKDSLNINEELRGIFGCNFPKKSEDEFCFSYKLCKNTEEFIENICQIDIKYSLNIECRVTQAGFRPILLSELLKRNMYLKHNKKLEFFIEKIDTDLNDIYDIYWKVKNEGIIAEKKNCIRGQIIKNNKKRIYESADFNGEHYVECYIIKNNVCIARDRINVPILNSAK